MKKLAKQLLSDVKELSDLKGKKVDEVQAMSLAIKAVESYSAVEDLSSDDKKALALAIVKEIVKARVGRKYGLVIGMMVSLINAVFGKNWLSKSK